VEGKRMVTGCESSWEEFLYQSEAEKKKEGKKDFL
jgi:hypothetical protein